jgi:predicted transposase YdaD
MVYKFSTLSWEAIEAMLNIQDIQLEQTRVYQNIEQKVRLDERRTGVLDLLRKKIGNISEPTQAQIAVMSLEQLRALNEALLDFQGASDLEVWLAER